MSEHPDPQWIRLVERASFQASKLSKVALFESPRALLDVYCLLPGQEQRVHAHAEVDKVYLVLSGSPSVTLGEETRVLGPQEVAVAPAGVAHGVRNEGPEPATLLVFQARPAP